MVLLGVKGLIVLRLLMKFKQGINKLVNGCESIFMFFIISLLAIFSQGILFLKNLIGNVSTQTRITGFSQQPCYPLHRPLPRWCRVVVFDSEKHIYVLYY